MYLNRVTLFSQKQEFLVEKPQGTLFFSLFFSLKYMYLIRVALFSQKQEFLVAFRPCQKTAKGQKRTTAQRCAAYVQKKKVKTFSRVSALLQLLYKVTRYYGLFRKCGVHACMLCVHMYMYICMYVYMLIYIIYIYIYIYIHTYTHTHTHTHACMCRLLLGVREAELKKNKKNYLRAKLPTRLYVPTKIVFHEILVFFFFKKNYLRAKLPTRLYVPTLPRGSSTVICSSSLSIDTPIHTHRQTDTQTQTKRNRHTDTQTHTHVRLV